MNKDVILCVDDEPITLNGLRNQLKNEFPDYTIECINDPTEVKEVIAELAGDNIKVAVVISDWWMPSIKGDDLLIDLHNEYPEMIKIILTGMVDVDSLGHAFNEANLYRCITKPWSSRELIQTLRNALSKKDGDLLE